jgi:hypothetical protein
MSTVSRRYVEWRIVGWPDHCEVLRRENGQPILVGQYPTMERARVAAEEDRATVLADPMATEFRKLEVRIGR